MNGCDQKYLVVDYFFDELTADQRRDFEKHLESCESCWGYLNTLGMTAKVIKKHHREKPKDEILHDYHHYLKKTFNTEVGSLSRFEELVQNFIKRPTIPVRIIEALVLLLIGFFIGKMTLWESESPHSLVTLNDQFNIEQVLFKNYLQETEMVLLDVANLDPKDDQKIIVHLVQSAQINYLLQKTILLRDQARKLGNDQLIDFLNQIELILLDLSNIKKNDLVETIAEIKQQLTESHLLIEIKSFKQKEI